MRKHKIYLIVLLLFLVVFFPSAISADNSGTMIVSVTVYDPSGPNLGIIAVPEKRILGGLPGTVKNWSSLIRVRVYPQNAVRNEENVVFSTTTTSDDSASSFIIAVGLQSGVYDVAAKVKTCLTRVLHSVTIDKYTDFDFTNNGIVFLLCGDINGEFGDDKVNAIDVGLLVDKWSTDDANADLNRDGLVNSIDISNMLTNFNEVGQ